MIHEATKKAREIESTKKGSCIRCGACCRLIPVPMDDIDWDLKWLEARGGVLKGVFGLLPLPCKYLTPANMCGIQENKPLFCQKFPVRKTAALVAVGCRFFDNERR